MGFLALLLPVSLTSNVGTQFHRKDKRERTNRRPASAAHTDVLRKGIPPIRTRSAILLFIAFAAISSVSLRVAAAAQVPTPNPAPVPVLVGGDPFGESLPPPRREIEARFAVAPNIVELARGRPRVSLALPDGRTAVLNVRKFEPKAGIEVLEDGTVVPSEDPNQLSYYILAQGVEGQLLLHVFNGHMHADLLGSNPLSIQYDYVRQQHYYDDFDQPTLGAGTCGVEPTSDGVLRLPISLNSESVDVPFAAQTTIEVSVLMVYTPEALTHAGSVLALQARAETAIEAMNVALDDSGQASYVRLVQAGGLFETTLHEQTEAENSNAVFRKKYLRNLARTDLGIQAERAAVEADLVVLLVADNGNAAGPLQYGVAFLQTENCTDGNVGTCNPGPAYEDWAVGVVAYDYATQNASFAHEVGHMFGAEHEPRRGVAEGFRLDLFPYGHRVPTVARDLMAQPDCVDDSGTTVCTTNQQLRYSNPTVYFAGTTNPSGTTTPYDATWDGSRTRDGARIIRKYAPAMANFNGAAVTDRVFFDGFE